MQGPFTGNSDPLQGHPKYQKVIKLSSNLQIEAYDMKREALDLIQLDQLLCQKADSPTCLTMTSLLWLQHGSRTVPHLS